MLYIIITILLFTCIILILKLYFIKKSIKEITVSLEEILNLKSNNLLTISSSDNDLKLLANKINVELKSLRKQRLQYENVDQSLKKNITNISHDIRTPLTAISGYIDMIKDSNDKSKTDKYVQIIQKRTNDLIALSDQLFVFSKSMDNNLKIEKGKYCINEILEEVLASYYGIFKEKNIVPKTEITKEKIYRNIDKNSIIRVIENIISNVIKYSDGDFKVILDKNGKIIFSNKSKSLDTTSVQKIFGRYFTVENAKKSTGIGLSIAKELIELNNGTINAKYIRGYLIIEIII